MSKCQCSRDFPEEPFAMLSGKSFMWMIDLLNYCLAKMFAHLLYDAEKTRILAQVVTSSNYLLTSFLTAPGNWGSAAPGH